MSIFLERQKVRKRKAFAKWFRVVERLLLSLIVVSVGLALLYGLYLLIFLGSTFAIHEVVVEGELSHLSKEKVVDIAQVKLGQNLFGIDVTAIHKHLKEQPWINHAAVRRRLPHTLWIYVDEYDPIAIIQRDGILYFVDHNGIAFKTVEPMDPKTFPIITGVDYEESNKTAPRLKEALALLSLFSNSSFGQAWGIAELNFDDVRGYSIMTDRGPVEILLGQGDLASRFDLLDRWLGVFNRRGAHIRYILANDEKRITVGYRES